MNITNSKDKECIFIESVSSVLLELVTNEEIDLEKLIDYWGGEYPDRFKPWEEEKI